MFNRVLLGVMLTLVGVGCGRHAPTPPAVGAVAFIDGSSAAAVRLVQSATGATSQSLSPKLGPASTPTWSPDGTRLAFSACPGTATSPKCYIYEMRADGSGRRKVAEGIAPRWSPLGDRIAFLALRGLYHDVYVVDANGQNERRLTSTPDDDTFGSSAVPVPSTAHADPWSPDERQFAVTRAVPASATVGAHSEIHVMRSDGTDDVQLAPTASDATFLAWSPDSKQLLVYATFPQATQPLYLVDRDSGQLHPLLPDVVNGIRPVAAWAPDGEHIAFAAGDSIYEVAANGTQLTILTRGQCDGALGLSWAPDSRELVFARGCTEPAAQVWQVMPGTSERPLSNTGGFAPAWSPAR